MPGSSVVVTSSRRSGGIRSIILPKRAAHDGRYEDAASEDAPEAQVPHGVQRLLVEPEPVEQDADADHAQAVPVRGAVLALALGERHGMRLARRRRHDGVHHGKLTITSFEDYRKVSSDKYESKLSFVI
jgi:hypothetical protein